MEYTITLVWDTQREALVSLSAPPDPLHALHLLAQGLREVLGKVRERALVLVSATAPQLTVSVHLVPLPGGQAKISVEAPAGLPLVERARILVQGQLHLLVTVAQARHEARQHLLAGFPHADGPEGGPAGPDASEGTGGP